MPAVAAGRRIEGTSLGDATGGRVSSEGPTAPIAAGGPVDLSSMPSRDPHQVLGVERGASQATIKAAWRRLARENHPDVVGSDPASARAATRRMAQINSAYEALRTSPGRSDRAGVGLDDDRPSRRRGGPPAPRPTRPVTGRVDTADTFRPRNRTTSAGTRSAHARSRPRIASRRGPRIRPDRSVAPVVAASSRPSRRASRSPSRSSSTSASSAVTPLARSPRSSRRTSTGSRRPSRVTRSWSRPLGRSATISIGGASSAGFGRPSVSSATGSVSKRSGVGSSPTRPPDLGRTRLEVARGPSAEKEDRLSIPRGDPPMKIDQSSRHASRACWPNHPWLLGS